MNENISVSFIPPQINIQAAEKPPTQSVSVKGECVLMAENSNVLPYDIHKSPRFQLFVADCLAKENAPPLSLQVEQNAYFFIQGKDPARVWLDYCDWFGKQQIGGRFLGETPDGRKVETKTTPTQTQQQMAVNQVQHLQQQRVMQQAAVAELLKTMRQAIDMLSQVMNIGASNETAKFNQ
ncbi:MAG: hypothetical protein IKI11_09000 [Neisseriaceae bacterium]|nr:hypothetical protein [Neisseriaceae bacterium]